MEAVIKALENLENMIYKILVWMILIPKTLLQIVLHPDWAPEYINKELDEGKSRFDEYLSPIVLLLVVALIPFIVWNFLPTPGVEVTSSSITNPTNDRNLGFDASIKFISSSTTGFVTTFWRVEQERYDGTNYSYPVLEQNRYTNNPEESNSIDYFNYYQIDSRTIQDVYNYQFSNPGRYWVVLDASKFDQDDILIETYSSDIYVYVPDNPDENVIVNSRTKPGDGKKLSLEEIANQLKSEQTIFLALGLLIPPLLFALAIKLFGKKPLSEDSLKETFYVQCYYFSPIAFIFWATSYAIKFFTPDVFFHYDTDVNLIVLLPLALAVFWFISVQTHAVANETKINGWFALLAVLTCMFVLLAGIMMIAFGDDPDVRDFVRRSSIWVYPLLSVGLLTAYHIMMVLRKSKDSSSDATELAEGEVKKGQPISTGDKILAGGIVFIVIIAMCLVLVAGQASNITSRDFDVTQQSVLLQSTAEVAKLDAQKFYTDEFDDPELKNWASPLMLSGDYGQFKYLVENSSLNLQLSQLEGQAPLAYLINNAFSYTDVQMEVLATNSDNNLNTVSLVCRFSDNGWYEFEISSSGEYVVSVADWNVASYDVLAAGESTAINTGVFANKYTAICKGDVLALYINDALVAAVRDATFKDTDGLIAIGVSSPNGLDVRVNFDYLKVSEPYSVPDVPAAVPETSDNTNVIGQPEEASPAEHSAPEDSPQIQEGFYTEEFKEGLDSWFSFTFGDDNRVDMNVVEDGLAFSLTPASDQTLSTYLINSEYLYTDVRIDLVATNNGNNSNDVGIVCQLNENGWYEFSISNGGSYAIYAYDENQDEFIELSSGNSPSIKTGLSTNMYTAVCKGSEISVYINGELVETVDDTTFNYGEGQVGLEVSSLYNLPVDVVINSVAVSEP